MFLEVSVFYYSMSVFFKVSAMTRLWARKSTDCMGYVSGLHSKIICLTFKTKLLQPHLRLSKSESLGGGPRLGKLLILLRSFQETAEVEKQVLYE